MVDLSRLAEPLSDASPCGIDCEYEGDFLALSQAVVGKPEQQFGDTVIPAVEPEWRSVERMATELLGRTKDIRVVVWLTLASTHLYGVAGFAAGVSLVLSLCERYWDDVHPRMVIDGDEDPYLRINALSALSDSGGGFSDGSGIMRTFRASSLVSQPLQVTVRDVELCMAKDPNARYSDTQITMALTNAAKANAGAVEHFRLARTALTTLNALVGERFGSGEQPDLSAMMALLKSVSLLIDRVGEGSTDSVSDDSAPADLEAPGALENSVSLVASGAIRSRADVNRALERVCEYLERYEPSNPAVLFARRAQNMLDRNFLDIMLELSPDSVQQLQLITGGKLPEQ